MITDPITRLRKIADDSGTELGLVSIGAGDLRALVAEHRAMSAASVDDEIAWLIEMQGEKGQLYFGIHYWSPTHGFHDDIEQALRFARKEDAEAFIREYKVRGVAREHMWPLAVVKLEGVGEPSHD